MRPLCADAWAVREAYQLLFPGQGVCQRLVLGDSCCHLSLHLSTALLQLQGTVVYRRNSRLHMQHM